MSWVLFTVCAAILGTGLAATVEWTSLRERSLYGLPPNSFRGSCVRAILVVLITTSLFSAYYWASPIYRCLDTPEVQPSGEGQNWRFAYHLTLIGLLILATAIDFDCYSIPDIITISGMLIGVTAACLIGELQICHLWVDWSVAIPQLRGPYIPGWYDKYRFWHALAWSLAGLSTGAGLTWLARFVSSRVIGQEAMGFGDVTLMAMIGSFLGWQAACLVFLIAPLTGLTIGVLIRTVSGKTFLPYGPWLSIAAVIVLFNWGLIWRQTRLIFSDWMGLATLAAVGSVGFVLLLGLTQLYKSIPTRSQSGST